MINSILKCLRVFIFFAALTLLAPKAFAFDIDISDAATPDEGAVNQTVAVFLSSAQSSTVTVNYATADGTATAGVDYTATSGTLTFAAGETVKAISIPILADTLDEDAETILVNISSASSGTIVDTQATVTIIDDDNAPTLTMGDATAPNENAATTDLTVTLSAASSKDITVNYATADSTATSGTDYTADSGTITISAGATTATIAVGVLSDSMDEDDEVVHVELSNPTNASIADFQGALTITDDDATPSLSIADGTSTDENSVTVVATLSAASGRSVTVNAAASDGTATQGSDFNAFSSTVTFASGETTKSVTLPLINDSSDEDDETFTVTLSSANNATISSATATATITDDDAPPALSIQTVSVAENAGTASLNVTLDAASEKTITVDYASSAGTACHCSSDFNAISSTTLTFSAGQTSKTISVTINDDSVDEMDETFDITLSNPSNATIAVATGTVTVTDNDPAPTISINDVTTADETAAASNLVATISSASEKTITIDFASSDGTATAGSDYTATSGTITFAAGETTKNIPISVVADAFDEIDETVSVTLSNPNNVTINDGVGELTITDDDVAPTLSIADLTIPDESAVSRDIVVTLASPSQQTITVDFATSDGTATDTNDYVSTTGTLTFNPGDTTKNIPITMVQDAIDEVNETFTVTISNPTNSTISTAAATITITDDDPTPSLAVNGANLTETSANLNFTVTLSGQSSQTVTASYATSDGSATAGADYTSSSGTVTFAPGVVSQIISVGILADTISEYDETFSVTLSSPSNATLGTPVGTMLINDDDALPSVSLGDASSTNETAASTNLVATLSAASGKPITVDYSTSDGTATAGSDYTADTGTITFAPGVTTQNIAVGVLADTTDEVNETVTVTLSNPSEVTLNDATGVLTITDDDTAPSISIADLTTTDETGISHSVTVTLSAASSQTITVDFATADGTATATNDYVSTTGTLTFNPGDTTKTISITIVQDSLDETNEAFDVGLSNATNASISDATGTVTITDDEGTPTLTIADVTTADEAAANVTATVTLSGVSSQTVTVAFATADVTATAAADYSATTGTLTFAPNVTTQTISIPILADTIDEANETFTVALSSPTNATVSSSSGTATMTITDDDAAPTISINDVSTADESAGSTNLVATLSTASARTITIDYATSDVTATASADYTVGTGTITFAPNVTTQNIPIAVLADTVDEVDETVTVTLSNPSNVTINDGIGELTITDDDGEPSLSIADLTTPDETAVTRSMTVTLSAASTKTVTVVFATADGTATAANDYISASGTLTFNPGITSQTVSITIVQDTIDEAHETFDVVLSNSANATISDATGVMTITDDETTPSLSIADASTTDETAANLTATVTLSGQSSSTVTVDYATSDGTASAAADYTNTSGTLTFNPGDTSQTFNIPILADTIDENNETFSVTLSSPTNATINDLLGQFTIVDDDTAPTVSLGDATTSNENAATTNLVATLSAASEKTITIDYATSDGTATAGSDYTADTGTITFAPNVTTQNVPVAVLADTTDEDDETVTVTLSNPSEVTLNDAIGLLTITDDDNEPNISIADMTTPNETAVGRSITVSLDAASEKTITVDYTTADGTATAANDYVSATGTLTFNAGETSKTISLSIVQDTIDELDETFTVSLSNPTNSSISTAIGTVTITDDEGTPTLSIADVTTTDESPANLTATVSLSGDSSQTVTVAWATSDGTATAAADYTAAGGTLTFSPGDTSKTVDITILADTIDEENETFAVALTSPTNALVSTSSGTATMTITDDDIAPTVSLGDLTSAETAGAKNLVATLSAASERSITVDYATSDFTATAGQDYTAGSGTITFSPGDTTQNVPVSTLADVIDEQDETVRLTLSNPVNVTLNDSEGILTITDDDSEPTVSIADITIPNENAVVRTTTVTLSAASEKTITVDYATADNTATAANDYISASGTLSFAPGDITKTVSFTMVQDTLDELDETFTIGLSNPTNTTISNATGTVTITDDEGTPSLSVAHVTTSDETATNLVATITLSGISSQTVTVNYATANGTATAGADYTSASGTLTFNAGDTSKTVIIPILADTIDEENETFTFTLSSALNATISSSSGVGTMTITDDDAAPTISINDVTAAENAGTTNLVATLSVASERTITVDYATSDDSASAGSDYTAGSGTITFAPGVTTQNVPIAIISDTTDEPDETIKVTLSNPVNVILNDPNGVLTITDDDSGTLISIDDLVTTNETALSNTVTVRLSSASGHTVTVNYATADGTATFNSDYNTASGTVSFAPGEVTKTINVDILADSLNEGNEIFYVNLSGATNASISDSQGSVTITDDDGAPTISIADAATSNENAAAITTTVTMSGASASTVTLDWSTSNGTASAGDDYSTAGGTLIFNPGETSKTVSVNVLADNLPEGTETFNIGLSNVSSGVTIADATGVITITDDDGNPTISISPATVSENTSAVSVDVSLSYLTPLVVTVDYATSDGTATAGSDYANTSGTLTFAANQLTQSISVPVVNDLIFENSKAFTITLSNPTNATIATAAASISITDDDQLLTQTSQKEISDAILFGKNSALRMETAFFDRIMSRNSTLLSSTNRPQTGPVMTFQNVEVDWSDNSELLKGSMSFDNVNAKGTRNTSWETSISHSKNDKGVKNTFMSTAFNFSTRPSPSTMYGLILGAGFSDTTMSGTNIGTNTGRSVSAGVYAAYDLADSLVLDLMASKTYENNSLDTNVNGVQVAGDYDRNSTAYSLGLAGKIRFSSSVLSPKLKYTIGKSAFEAGTFDVRNSGLSSQQQIDFGSDEYFRFSFSPEFGTVLGDPVNLLRPYGFNYITLKPKVFCEKYDYEASRKCGQGLGLTLSNNHPTYNFDQDLSFDYDKIGGAETYSLLYKRLY